MVQAFGLAQEPSSNDWTARPIVGQPIHALDEPSDDWKRPGRTVLRGGEETDDAVGLVEDDVEVAVGAIGDVADAADVFEDEFLFDDFAVSNAKTS